ncbi:MAG: hypothetical protein HQL05_05020 [Nitrospirae bacterium]|uniref:hypothetical protein n=1 Tax=Candidatus Magnetobacterium casense TaxID=1455061 RepID=UPI00058F0E56|nr:hypothetical protein [Candidatus Magnetobacterium casensis]MBF0337174.1 hypothetical protein [Nitrospirota bacterium]
MRKNTTVRYVVLTGIMALLPVIYACDYASETKEDLSTITDKKVDKIEKSRVATDKSDLEALKRGITGFNAANGRYPKDLDELQEFTAINFDKGIYNYNPQTGAITMR